MLRKDVALELAQIEGRYELIGEVGEVVQSLPIHA